MANLGMVIDLGTTAISAYLISLDNNSVNNGQIVENPQRLHKDSGAQRRVMLDQTNAVIDSLCGELGLSGEDINQVVVVGNPVMVDLVINSTEGSVVEAGELGLRVNPKGEVIVPPAVGGMIGCDITAGLLTNRLYDRQTLSLYIDLGTYATIVLGTREGFLATSVYNGVFEGVGLTDGMVAAAGAIYKVDFSLSPMYKAYGIGAPQGICGGGVIDTLAHLRTAGLIDERGKITRGGKNIESRLAERLTELDGQPAFQVANARESGRPPGIVMTQADIDKTVQAKATVAAATQVLLKMMGADKSEVRNIYLTGSLSNSINYKYALSLGLIPAVDCNIFYISNAAGKGATQILRYRQNLDICYDVRERIRPVEVKKDAEFERLITRNAILKPAVSSS